MRILTSVHARVLTLILLAQAIAFYAVASRKELDPDVRPLSEFPVSIGNWYKVAEYPMEKEIQDFLRADDTLNRTYLQPADNSVASMFIAFFKTQRTGQSPHSPKNCLPGSGWEPSVTGLTDVDVPGVSPRRITVNRYIVSRGNQQSVVLYWYQSHGRVIASEFSAKFWLVADAIRYRRSDTALVRVTVPVTTRNPEAALRVGVSFVQALYPEVEKQLPR
jgi:EpsI family protein